MRRPAISAKVIKELLRLGYLQPAKRFKPHIVERALVRLRADLVRDGVVKGGNSLSDPISSATDDSQPSASVPGTSSQRSMVFAETLRAASRSSMIPRVREAYTPR